jgi:hypothetical protein
MFVGKKHKRSVAYTHHQRKTKYARLRAERLAAATTAAQQQENGGRLPHCIETEPHLLAGIQPRTPGRNVGSTGAVGRKRKRSKPDASIGRRTRSTDSSDCHGDAASDLDYVPPTRSYPKRAKLSAPRSASTGKQEPRHSAPLHTGSNGASACPVDPIMVHGGQRPPLNPSELVSLTLHAHMCYAGMLPREAVHALFLEGGERGRRAGECSFFVNLAIILKPGTVITPVEATPFLELKVRARSYADWTLYSSFVYDHCAWHLPSLGAPIEHAFEYNAQGLLGLSAIWKRMYDIALAFASGIIPRAMHDVTSRDMERHVDAFTEEPHFCGSATQKRFQDRSDVAKASLAVALGDVCAKTCNPLIVLAQSEAIDFERRGRRNWGFADRAIATHSSQAGSASH